MVIHQRLLSKVGVEFTRPVPVTGGRRTTSASASGQAAGVEGGLRGFQRLGKRGNERRGHVLGRTEAASPASAASTAAVAAPEESATETGSGDRGRDEERTLAAEVEVSETEGGEGGGVLVPTFCPSAPFERYAALHRKITQGELEPRWVRMRREREGKQGKTEGLQEGEDVDRVNS